ncbi:GNAT family N-acetyltransferase [Chengkuizengella axinellae]|uniref:GNAT family N-acetyltransferase n=1 Tax=Chengkuizengella axinellae TaxID=3064388 RepID=A0ABT9J3T6_9BACL|nr:GNAT family N-acetyltransferase [Chengkuizengella sp. 2205SS18-9]MDP5276281.1 GNAT family N-acetyltransferase [Chengkuizengella sp. 2205SS18-9]
MIKKIDITTKDVAEQVLRVQIPSYKVEADMINFYDIPPLKDSAASLQRSEETFCGYYVGEELAGVISYEIETSILTICRMIVHPDFFRKGIASALLHSLFESSLNVKKMVVSTGRDNEPAKKLYKKHGFHEVRDVELSHDVFITRLQKMMD